VRLVLVGRGARASQHASEQPAAVEQPAQPAEQAARPLLPPPPPPLLQSQVHPHSPPAPPPTHRRPQQTDPAACDPPAASGATVDVLAKWAAADPGWDRLLSSVSLYEIARHAYQQAQHDEAIIALEESLALRLFAYVDQPTLDKWQQVGLRFPLGFGDWVPLLQVEGWALWCSCRCMCGCVFVSALHVVLKRQPQPVKRPLSRPPSLPSLTPHPSPHHAPTPSPTNRRASSSPAASSAAKRWTWPTSSSSDQTAWCSWLRSSRMSMI